MTMLTRDPTGMLSQEIRMVDPFGRVGRMVIPTGGDIGIIGNMWKNLLDVSNTLTWDCARHNELECHWGYREGSAVSLISCILISNANRGLANIDDGSDASKADQMGRILDVKVPPFEKRQVGIKDSRATTREQEEWIPLGLRVSMEHDLAFQMEGRPIEAPSVTSWWLPYNLEAVMRYGNSVNSDIPLDPDEAEFPPLPWADRVIIRTKSAAAPSVPPAPLPAGGSPPPPGSPRTWVDVNLGHSPPISDASSGMVGYKSTNDVRAATDGQEEAIPEELADFRGWTGKDEEVHKLVSWTTLKDYPTHIGISLEIEDRVGDGSHEIQFWERVLDLPPIGSAAEMYNWLVETLRSRSRSNRLPRAMPPTFEGIEAHTERKGDGGYIRFELEESTAAYMSDQPNAVQLEYGSRYARIGMGDTYTIRMLKNEFGAVIGDDWSLYPSLSHRRRTDGTILHHTVTDVTEIKGAVEKDLLFDLPERYQEDAGRGTDINLRSDQLRVLDYWAQTGQTALVGVSLQVDNHTVEYWMPMTIDPIADEPSDTYLINLQIQWQNRIREISPCIVQCFDNAAMSFRFKMRYQGNTLRV
jgi:hypothetical protein